MRTTTIVWRQPLRVKEFLVIFAVVIEPSALFGQGPSSRGSFSGPAVERTYVTRGARGEILSTETVLEQSEGPDIPDLFRMEAPFVERNFRLDYDFTNHLQDPLADESQFFGEINYSFTKQFGINIACPFLSRDNFDGTDASGMGDLEAGARFVAIGYDAQAPFKMAFGFNVTSPTGDVDDDLGEGVTFLEPQILMLRKLPKNTFVQTQFGIEIPTNSGETTGFGYNIGIGRIFETPEDSMGFSNPTPTLELNGTSGIGGAEAGTTVLDLTTGIRFKVGEKTFAGAAISVPLTGEREFETQYIFSVIHQYGADEGAGSGGGPTSRAAF